MNQKHLAALIVGTLAFAFFLGVQEARKHLSTVEAALAEARSAAAAVESQRDAELSSLTAIRTGSAAMLEFLEAWSAAFESLESVEAAELAVASRVKDSTLMTLAQRFEVVPQPGDTIPRMIRAHLTFEDDYARTLNWLGETEAAIPAARIGSLSVSQGESARDIRMQLVLELPIPVPGS